MRQLARRLLRNAKRTEKRDRLLFKVLGPAHQELTYDQVISFAQVQEENKERPIPTFGSINNGSNDVRANVGASMFGRPALRFTNERVDQRLRSILK